ncbi:MAG TPA: winged helix-turn-helix domain-containing protein [Candidatus Angelobacter sp.]|nr:winged helix-turn-helix domain-containing protein [Candidatus Angelobacter sp.]
MKRRAPYTLPQIRLRRHSPKTLQAQLLEFLRPAISDLAPGTRLPSTRVVAQHLRVSRNTVLNVYEELALEGLLTSRTGSGTRVSQSSSRSRRGPTFPVNLDMSRILRESQYPAGACSFRDPDGHPIYLHS